MTHRRSSVREKSIAAARLKGWWKARSDFDLVAELRFLLPIFVLILTMFVLVNCLFMTAVSGGSLTMGGNLGLSAVTFVSSVLTSSTTTCEEQDLSVGDFALNAQTVDVSQSLDKVEMILSHASFTTTLAISTASPTDEQPLEVIHQIDSSDIDVSSLFEPNPRVSSKSLKETDVARVISDPWWFQSDEDDERVLDVGVTETISEELGHDNSSNASDHRHLSWFSGANNSSTILHNRSHFSGLREMLWADSRKLSSMRDPARDKSGKLMTTHWAMKHRFHLVMVLLGSLMICAAISMMQHQRGQGHQGFRQPPHQYQADVGAATLKTPPSWCYEQASSYSLRSWISDVVMWSTATDLEPERQAAAVALQVTGAARELIREIPARQLRDGVYENGVHTPGLYLLCRTLANHYAPLEAELQTRSMAELMQFSRMGNETIDSCLTRFEVLQHRAVQRGGLMLNPTTLSYVLMNGLRLRPDQWDRALIATDGALPVDEHQFQQLTNRLRRIGRMQEGQYQAPFRQGATGDVGTYYFPTFSSDDCLGGIGATSQSYYGSGNVTGSDSLFQPFEPMPEVPMSSGAHAAQSFASMPLNETEDQCTRCGMFYEDEFSSSTETDDGESDPDASKLYAHYDSDPALLGNVLYGEYMLAKQRWRRFSGRPPRRYRRGHFNKFRQKNNYQKLQRFGKTYASFLPPNAFAAHRGPGGKSGGKSGGKGAKSKMNPRGRDGQPLKCHRCGSVEHLIRKCPNPDNKPGSAPQPNALAMLAGSSNLQFFAGGHALNAMTMANVQSLGSSSVAGSSASSKRVSSVKDDLESLRSIASSRRKIDASVASADSEQHVVDYSLNPAPRCPPPDEPAPTFRELQVRAPAAVSTNWTTFTTGTAAATDDLMKGLLDVSRRPKRQHALQDGEQSESQVSGLSRRDHDEKKKAREATTLQLTKLLRTVPDPVEDEHDDRPSFPWWEMVEDVTAENVPAGTFHSMRTCARDGRIGLLVDPGAHDNLAGEWTMRDLEQQLRTRARVKQLDHPLSVSGVGKQAQQASVALSLDFDLFQGLPEQTRCSYTAPVISESRLPPLLGLKSLASKRAILDTHGKLLILPGAGGVEFKCSPGTQILPLEMSESGHLLLPMLPRDESSKATASSTMMPNRVDFNVQCRRARTPSPQRSHAPNRPGPYRRSGNTVLTGVPEDKSVSAVPSQVYRASDRPNTRRHVIVSDVANPVAAANYKDMSG